MRKQKALTHTSGSLQIPVSDKWGSNIQPTIRPTEYRCYIKEVIPICNSGCSDSIVEYSFVLRANSPSRWHLTRCLLLCSPPTIHDFTGNGNYFFIDISGMISSRFPTGIRMLYWGSYISECCPGSVTASDQPGTNGLRALARPGFCRIILAASLPFSAVFPFSRTYNGPT